MALFRKHEGRQVLELPVDALAPNPNQPRKHFSQEELNELADSISQLGVMQPLTVRRRDRGWELIAGERRWRAAQLAGLSTVPCLEVSATDEASSLMALVENLQRKDLDFWEEALALRRLVDNYQLSQEEVARQVGKSQSAVANKLRLLKLPTDVLDSLRTAGLSERHARALLRLEGPELQRQAAAIAPEQRHRQMGMGIDQAGHNQAAGSIDDPVIGAIHPLHLLRSHISQLIAIHRNQRVPQDRIGFHGQHHRMLK